MTCSVEINATGKARSLEAGAGTVSRPIDGLNAGSTPAPTLPSVEGLCRSVGALGAGPILWRRALRETFGTQVLPWGPPFHRWMGLGRPERLYYELIDALSDDLQLGEGFAFFRGHCLTLPTSPCLGLAERRTWGGRCGYFEFDWSPSREQHKTALEVSK